MLNIITSSRFKINRKLIIKFVSDLLVKYEIPPNAALNIIFIGRKKMKSIAAKYKNENVALPVLSFSYLNNQVKTSEVEEDPELAEGDGKTSEVKQEKVFGEIFICYPQAVLLAAEREKKVDDIILFLIKHGIDNILK